MPDFKSRLKPFSGRSSTATTISSQSSTSSATDPLGQPRNLSKTSLLLSKVRKKSSSAPVSEETLHPAPPLPAVDNQSARDDPPPTPATSLETPGYTPFEKPNPTLTVEEPTPDLAPAIPDQPVPTTLSDDEADPTDAGSHAKTDRRETGARRQSLTHSTQSRFLETLLESENSYPEGDGSEPLGVTATAMVSASMLHRKIWVRRPGQSATMVSIKEDDLVDDVRDMILKKYANSLGRNFDSPDVTLRITTLQKHQKSERVLGPEESIAKALDAVFPNGQTVDQALVIDVPHRRTPKHSPRIHMPYYATDDLRPGESATDYFSSMPIPTQPSPGHPTNIPPTALPVHPATMTIINGQIPQIPSPGGVRATRQSSSNSSLPQRPRYQRQNTTSPSVHGGITKVPTHDSLKSHSGTTPAPPPLPSPVLATDGPPHSDRTTTTPPVPRTSSPRPTKTKKAKKQTDPKAASGLLDGTVPPISVLIVEDNIINLRLLEAFMKRLKVRWHTAMNGREAIQKWRQGGFHLVLMDIQLPVMNGLAATKEIRRLERVNHIGVFENSAASTPIFPSSASSSSSSSSSSAEEEEGKGKGDGEGDKQGNDMLDNASLFKSPVIIVALTASSLQSDRHEALAAGCNDFLTKPVNFVWLERKVREWGCMQALIDFDGWRKWKDFSQPGAAAAAATATGTVQGGGGVGGVKEAKDKTSPGGHGHHAAGGGAGGGGGSSKIGEGPG
ncbi:MAG: hypothetical protein Q9214_001923, partial [Letrouitia sp. 1 TL-2023]